MWGCRIAVVKPEIVVGDLEHLLGLLIIAAVAAIGSNKVQFALSSFAPLSDNGVYIVLKEGPSGSRREGRAVTNQDGCVSTFKSGRVGARNVRHSLSSFSIILKLGWRRCQPPMARVLIVIGPLSNL